MVDDVDVGSETLQLLKIKFSCNANKTIPINYDINVKTKVAEYKVLHQEDPWWVLYHLHPLSMHITKPMRLVS